MARVNHTRITRITLKIKRTFPKWTSLCHSFVISFSIHLYLDVLYLSCCLNTYFDHAVFLASSFLSVTPSPYSYPDFPINPITIRGMLNRDRATSGWGRERKIRLGWDESEWRRQDGAEWWHRRQQLSKTDREAVRQGHSHATHTHTHTHIQTQTGGQWTLHRRWSCPSPPPLKTISAFLMF